MNSAEKVTRKLKLARLFAMDAELNRCKKMPRTQLFCANFVNLSQYITKKINFAAVA